MSDATTDDAADATAASGAPPGPPQGAETVAPPSPPPGGAPTWGGALTVEMDTDDTGYGSAVVDVPAFDVVDATADDGSETISWDWVTPSTTKVELRSPSVSSKVTVTLTLKGGQ